MRDRLHALRRIAVGCLTGLAVHVAPASAGTLTLGIGDPAYDPGAPASLNAAYLDKTVALGVGTVRMTAQWRSVAPVRPSGDPADPANPAYDFKALDVAVRNAAARGLSILLLVAVAPDWAEDGTPPRKATPGSWSPNAYAFGQFMHALAARYSGSFDPGTGDGALPLVGAFQIWNEPNLPIYLAPQWRRNGKGEYRPVAPELYRDLLNAAYPQIKAASPRALVVEAGTAPYGDPKPGGLRMPPMQFVRALLCLGGSSTHPTTRRCPDPVHLDVWSHHPYGVAAPFTHTYWPDDVTLEELGRLTRAWSLAEKTGRVLPPGRRPRWTTEFGWESKPDPTGLAQATQATWMGQALYLLDKAGFDAAFWYRIHDDRPVPSWGYSVQSGLYGAAGRAKPASSMFTFPVAGIRRGGGRMTVFAVPPGSGTCVAERHAANGWTRVASGSCAAHVPWKHAVPGRSDPIRVRVGDRVSSAVRPGG